MKLPFRRRPADPSVEAALRASLAQHARHAPSGDPLAERILAAVDAPWSEPVPRRSSWRAWGLPLVAAGSVAAVVAAVVALQDLGQSNSSQPPALHSGSPLRTHVSTPSVTPTTPAPPSSSSTQPPSAGSTALHGVRVLDLTFANTDDGWALATAVCTPASGRTGRCIALLRTHDGRHWTSIPGAVFNAPGITGGCADPCVDHLRFATDEIGYAFGPSALFMTTDGGANWQRLPGGALYLETLNQNVIRVTSTGSGCPAACFGAVETAPIGSTVWTTRPLPGDAGPDGFAFSRGGDDAYLLFTGHVTGGAANATSTLYRSTDNGQTWTKAGEPCPQTSGEVDSTTIAAGAVGRVSVLCRVRQAPNRAFVATSSDAGLHFTAQPGTVPAATADQLSGDPATVLVTAGAGVARSTDGGRSWQRVPQFSTSVGFVGFESAHVGRVVPTGGRTIWTTRDGGGTWSPVHLG